MSSVNQFKRVLLNFIFLLPVPLMRKVFGGGVADKFLRKLFPFQFQGLHSQLLPFTSQTKTRLFVEIGANDGLSQSNTRVLEIEKGWHGVLIEPDPISFRRLEKLRSRGNYLENSACVSYGFKSETASFDSLNLMSTSPDLVGPTFDLDKQRRKGLHFFRPRKKTFVARVKTMDEVLESSGLGNKFGLLSVDVEGAELEVFGGIDFSRYQFELILVETDELERVAELLNSNGFQLARAISSRDYLFSLYSPVRHAPISIK